MATIPREKYAYKLLQEEDCSGNPIYIQKHSIWMAFLVDDNVSLDKTP